MVGVELLLGFALDVFIRDEAASASCIEEIYDVSES